MKFPRIINGKFVSIIAAFIGVIFILPLQDNHITISDIFHAILWFSAGFFTWSEKRWAAVLLGLLTFYDLILTLIPRIINFEEDIQEMASELGMRESIVIKAGIITYSLGIIAILCILYYVAMILLGNRNKNIGDGSYNSQ